jgi:hypothetical protein
LPRVPASNERPCSCRVLGRTGCTGRGCKQRMPSSKPPPVPPRQLFWMPPEHAEPRENKRPKPKQAPQCEVGLGAAALKERGNAEFQAGHYEEAKHSYTLSLHAHWAQEIWTPDDQVHLLYSNRSAANLKLGLAHYAAADAIACIRAEPSFLKVNSFMLCLSLAAPPSACVRAGAHALAHSCKPSHANILSRATCD